VSKGRGSLVRADHSGAANDRVAGGDCEFALARGGTALWQLS